MTTISNNQIAEAIYLASIEHAEVEQSFFFPKVINFLAKKRLFSRAPEILKSLDKIVNEKEGRIVAKISSARNLGADINGELARALAKRYSAKEVALVENIDEKLRGGFKVEVNDEVIDLTLKNKIGQLQKYLTTEHEYK